MFTLVCSKTTKDYFFLPLKYFSLNDLTFISLNSKYEDKPYAIVKYSTIMAVFFR